MRQQNWRFVAAIVLGLVLAPVALTWLTYDLIDRVSTGANEQDHRRTHQIVESALGALQNDMVDLAGSSANWDDAVRNLYGSINDEWLADTWGNGTEFGMSYNGIFIIDPTQAQAIAGYLNGKPLTPEHADYFGNKLPDLIKAFPSDQNSYSAQASILKTADGPALVGVALIEPTNDDLTYPDDKPLYLVLVRHLTPDVVSRLGNQYVISDLVFRDAASATPADSETGALIRDLSSDPVGVMNWTDSRPGDAVRAPVLRMASLILGFTFVIMIAAAYLCLRFYRVLSERERRAREEAQEDALSGLPNRVALMEGMASALKSRGSTASLAFIDLDGFKAVNDTHGHETGDQLIRAVSAGLKTLCGPGTSVHRLGGDEFVALIRGKNSELQANRFAHQVLGLLAVPFDLDGHMVSVGASIGIATAAGPAGDGSDLLHRADLAMYRAKTAGKNQIQLYGPHMQNDEGGRRSHPQTPKLRLQAAE